MEWIFSSFIYFFFLFPRIFGRLCVSRASFSVICNPMNGYGHLEIRVSGVNVFARICFNPLSFVYIPLDVAHVRAYVRLLHGNWNFVTLIFVIAFPIFACPRSIL